MKIIWNQVTKLSQIVAVILFIIIFIGGMWLGKKVERQNLLGNMRESVVYNCQNNHSITADYFDQAVNVMTDSGMDKIFLQTISASGARFENKDSGLIFWNKGKNAFIMQNDNILEPYSNCNSVTE
jgi:membrane-bound inhibitor of C-type lysozyme